MNKSIYVTQPSLPPLEEFIPYLEQIWQSKVLTNGGKFHKDLEAELKKFLGIKEVSLFANATIGLVTALQSLKITGEVITTPYSFVATAHSLLWNGITPVFVDIDPETLNIDPKKIESAITDKTTAILAVHCYGNPCAVKEIKEIADKYNLKVIYDAAHAFGVKDKFGSILNYGDLSVLSFHATKVFNTFEGGAIVSMNKEMKLHIDHLKNFGFIDEITVVSPGINGKMSEINAAFGLLQLKYIESMIAAREKVDKFYRHALKAINGISCIKLPNNSILNYSYFPILVDDSFRISRDSLYEKLKKNNIYARRYFYPLISNFPMYRIFPSSDVKNLPIANRIADQVLCLPIHPGLTEAELGKIVELISDCNSL